MNLGIKSHDFIELYINLSQNMVYDIEYISFCLCMLYTAEGNT